MSTDKHRIYGLRAVIEAIKSGKTIDKIFIQKGLKGMLFLELEALIKKENINIAYVPVEKLNRLHRENHQGVVANVSPIAFHDFETLVDRVIASENRPLFLLLDQVSDVRNFGAIIRTASCTGVDGIVIQKSGSAPVTADTVKTSAGAVFKVPICKVTHLKDAVYYLQASGVKVIGATEKTERLIYACNLNDPIAIIMGSEAKGIAPSLLKITDEKAGLPIHGAIDSLNVSVACGALLYEVIRQRQLD